METQFLNDELQFEIKKHGADFTYFVDISQLPKSQNKGYPRAVIFGFSLSVNYLKKVSGVPNYVEQMIKSNQIKSDEFYLKEIEADKLADYIAEDIVSLGYKAYSQSEANIEETGYYCTIHKTTPLPHKTIACLAGIGWIGKHNLLIIPEYGSAFCMCSVLTNAPLETVAYQPMDSKCKNCNICKNTCTVNAIKGKSWDYGISRDEIVDVSLCNTCLKCLVHCPWTQRYIRKANSY